MKKFLALLLALAMVLSLAACGGNDEEDTAARARGPRHGEEAAGVAAET